MSITINFTELKNTYSEVYLYTPGIEPRGQTFGISIRDYHADRGLENSQRISRFFNQTSLARAQEEYRVDVAIVLKDPQLLDGLCRMCDCILKFILADGGNFFKYFLYNQA